MATNADEMAVGVPTDLQTRSEPSPFPHPAPRAAAPGCVRALTARSGCACGTAADFVAWDPEALQGRKQAGGGRAAQQQRVRIRAKSYPRVSCADLGVPDTPHVDDDGTVHTDEGGAGQRPEPFPKALSHQHFLPASQPDPGFVAVRPDPQDVLHGKESPC